MHNPNIYVGSSLVNYAYYANKNAIPEYWNTEDVIRDYEVMDSTWVKGPYICRASDLDLAQDSDSEVFIEMLKNEAYYSNKLYGKKKSHKKTKRWKNGKHYIIDSGVLYYKKWRGGRGKKEVTTVFHDWFADEVLDTYKHSNVLDEDHYDEKVYQAQLEDIRDSHAEHQNDKFDAVAIWSFLANIEEQEFDIDLYDKEDQQRILGGVFIYENEGGVPDIAVKVAMECLGMWAYQEDDIVPCPHCHGTGLFAGIRCDTCKDIVCTICNGYGTKGGDWRHPIPCPIYLDAGKATYSIYQSYMAIKEAEKIIQDMHYGQLV